MKLIVKSLVVVLTGMVLAVGQAVAGTIYVTVKNLTNGLYFTPLLITAHDGDIRLFEMSVPASGALQAMAEGGDISLLSAMVGGADKDTVENPAKGLLGPGERVTDIKLDTNRTRNRNGGISDLDSSVHRWLNPVAEIVIEVQGRKHK